MTFGELEVGAMFSFPNENGNFIKRSVRTAVREYDSDVYPVRAAQAVYVEYDEGFDEYDGDGNDVNDVPAVFPRRVW